MPDLRKIFSIPGISNEKGYRLDTTHTTTTCSESDFKTNCNLRTFLTDTTELAMRRKKKKSNEKLIVRVIA